MDCPAGNAYKVSVTDSPFCVIWHDKHSAELSAFGRYTPYPAAPDFPRKRGQNKSLYAFLQRHGSMAKTHSPTAPRGEGGAVRHQRGMHFLARRAVVRRRQRRHKKWRRRHRTSPAQRYYITPEGGSPQPACKAKPITGRTLGAQGRQARRRHQPSRRSRVNLREYSFPPNPSQKPMTSNDTHSKKALTITVSAFSS